MRKSDAIVNAIIDQLSELGLPIMASTFEASCKTKDIQTKDTVTFLSEIVSAEYEHKMSERYASRLKRAHLTGGPQDISKCVDSKERKYIPSGVTKDLATLVTVRAAKIKDAAKRMVISLCFFIVKPHMSACPDTNITEMDSVEGRKGGKVLLTIYFCNCELMLAFIRDANTARSVTDIFNDIDSRIGRHAFTELFQLILTDRGSEFTNPLSIECDEWGEIRTKIFYCDPQRSDQKGGCEVTHEMIRRVLPKGTSFDNLTQADINLMMSHINSYTRKKLGNQTPYRLFSSFYGEDLLTKLQITQIPPNEINLTPKLLNK